MMTDTGCPRCGEPTSVFSKDCTRCNYGTDPLDLARKANTGAEIEDALRTTQHKSTFYGVINDATNLANKHKGLLRTSPDKDFVIVMIPCEKP